MRVMFPNFQNYACSEKLLKDKAPAKRSQHANSTYRNVVAGRNMLCAFGYRVVICYDMLHWMLVAKV